MHLGNIAAAAIAVVALGLPAHQESPAVHLAAQAPCAPGFLVGGNLLCQPDPTAPAAPAAVTPSAPAPPHRSLLDRILGRNKPAPAASAPAPVTAAPPAQPAPARPVTPVQSTPTPPPPVPTPRSQQEAPLVPVEILPAPVLPGPTPADRTVWLHTCVDLYAADVHLLQLDRQVLDVAPLAYVLFACSSNPTLVPVVPGVPVVPVVPGEPPSAASQTIETHLPVTG